MPKDNNFTIALAGNPNVGKSTVFNNLTGLNQHTGNWTGKTVENAKGKCKHNGIEYTIMDLPGIYSIMSSSGEEELARDYICFDNPDVVVVVADATILERNLNLLLQIIEITPKAVLCLNLMDEAKKKKISVNAAALQKILGIPVVCTTARKKKEAFKIFAAAEKANESTRAFLTAYPDAVERALSLIELDIQRITQNNLNSRFIGLKLLGCEHSIIKNINHRLGIDLYADTQLAESLAKAQNILNESGINEDNFVETIVGAIIANCEKICTQTVVFENPDYNEKDRKIDKIVTSKIFGIPLMLLLLGIVFFITIELANYPSQWLSLLFSFLGEKLNLFLSFIHTPYFIQAPLMDGIYNTTAWVVSVMLPPMAIFFPLFTLLEDLGYLPRVAFNLDRPFKKSGCCGKQCLTMCMGFGCNAAAVVGTRIIDSPREKLIAIVTNNFVPCNGRFPTLITVASFFIGGTIANAFLSGLVSTLALTGIVLLGIITTLLVSKFLSKTFLKGVPSSFKLELPPYRKPQLGKILVRSLLDRTVFVLGRAVIVAAPCGLLIWLLANINVNSYPLLYYIANFLSPFAKLMGMDGYILTAFILGFPANEIVVPITIMSYLSTGSLTNIGSITQIGNLFKDNGWTLITGINVLLFTLFHFPCATTCLSIKKETKSIKWTFLSVALPTVLGIVVCMLFTAAMAVFGLYSY